MVFKQWAAVALLACTAGARAYEPQAGTWVVSSEVDGKPGRGLSVDVQNGTLALQMYAYENSGQPTFYLAVGTVADNRVTARLNRYTGGRYFGSPAQSGTEAGSPGNVTIRFTSGTTGFITFPNEPEKPISRFNFGYPQKPSSLAGIWTFTSVGSKEPAPMPPCWTRRFRAPAMATACWRAATACSAASTRCPAPWRAACCACASTAAARCSASM